MTIRIVLHGRGARGTWTRIADAPYHQDLPDPAALRAAVAHAKRTHFPLPSADVATTLHLWVMHADAALPVLDGDAGGGPLAVLPDVERTLAVRAEVPDPDEGHAAEARVVRDLLTRARDGRLAVFLLVNMDGNDSPGELANRGRIIGPP